MWHTGPDPYRASCPTVLRLRPMAQIGTASPVEAPPRPRSTAQTAPPIYSSLTKSVRFPGTDQLSQGRSGRLGSRV
eukprot:939881-Rhodomonas_salina.1